MQDLINAAHKLVGKFALSRSDGSAASVACALRTTAGHIYTGVCMDLNCGIGFCAEHAAVAEMLKHRETHIESIVAVSRKGILAPCGRCREMMAQVDARNFDTRIILSDERVMLLRELLPEHWDKPGQK